MSSMVDPDDIEAIALERAFEELVAVASTLAQPELAMWAWVDTLVAVLLHQQCPGRPLDWIMLLTLRRVTQDMRSMR